MGEQIKGHILAILTITIWSSTFIISKILLENMTPLHILYIRYAIALIILTVIHPKFTKPSAFKEELVLFLISGSLVAYFIFENSALKITYSSNVSLIVATIPLITGVLSMFILKTRFFTRSSILGFIIAYAGVFMVIINGNSLEGVEPLGDFFALGAAVSFAVYSVLMQKLKDTYHMVRLTRKVFFYGFIIMSVIVAIKRPSYAEVTWSMPLIGALLFLGIIASSFAFIMWNHAIKIIGPIKTNQYIYLVPVVTTVFAFIVLGEKITLLTIGGTACILIGLYLSDRIKKKDLSEPCASDEAELKQSYE